MDINYLKNSTYSYDGGKKKPLKFKDETESRIFSDESQKKVYSDHYIKSNLLKEESKHEIYNSILPPLQHVITTGPLINCEAIISRDVANFIINEVNNIIINERLYIKNNIQKKLYKLKQDSLNIKNDKLKKEDLEKKYKEEKEKIYKEEREAIDRYNKSKRTEITFQNPMIKRSILIYKKGSWITKGKYVIGFITGINAGDNKTVKIKIGEESFDLDFNEICIDTRNFRIPK
tara:strand:+ start:180 stop:878 length:699 start_codon:yes stop_codon:yes gene_type:complete